MGIRRLPRCEPLCMGSREARSRSGRLSRDKDMPPAWGQRLQGRGARGIRPCGEDRWGKVGCLPFADPRAGLQFSWCFKCSERGLLLPRQQRGPVSPPQRRRPVAGQGNRMNKKLHNAPASYCPYGAVSCLDPAFPGLRFACPGLFSTRPSGTTKQRGHASRNALAMNGRVVGSSETRVPVAR